MKETLRANDREQYLKRKLQETNEFNAKESVLCTSLRGIFFIGEVCVPELREPSQQLYLQRCQPLVAPYLPGPLPLLVWYLGPWPSAGIFSFWVDLIGRLRLPHYSVARLLPHYTVRLVSLNLGFWISKFGFDFNNWFMNHAIVLDTVSEDQVTILECPIEFPARTGELEADRSAIASCYIPPWATWFLNVVLALRCGLLITS